jgi:hypothetical protein
MFGTVTPFNLVLIRLARTATYVHTRADEPLHLGFGAGPCFWIGILRFAASSEQNTNKSLKSLAFPLFV